MFTQLTIQKNLSDQYTDHEIVFEHNNSKGIKSVKPSCGCTSHKATDQSLILFINIHPVEFIVPKQVNKNNYTKTVTALVTYMDDTQDTITANLNIYRHEKLDTNKKGVYTRTELLGVESTT